MTKKLTLEGKLDIWSQEGGHAAPSVQIGGDDLTGEIEKFFDEYTDRRTGEIGGNVPGKWRITLERSE